VKVRLLVVVWDSLRAAHHINAATPPLKIAEVVVTIAVFLLD